MARRFSYQGNHAEVRPFGLRFPQGEPVEIEDDFVARKLAGNIDFREHFDGEQVLKAALAESMRLDPPVSDLVHRGPTPEAEPIPNAPVDSAPPLVLPVVTEPPKRKPGRPRKEQ